MDLLADEAVERQGAEFGDGFWSDHWTYSLDLVETYLRLYPDREAQFLFDTQVLYINRCCLFDLFYLCYFR